MMLQQVRNPHFLPCISEEGILCKALPSPPNPEDEGWSNCLNPFDRVFLHQTLASTRRSANFRNYS